MSKQPPPALTASAVGPCPTLSQTSRTPRHWKFTQRHRTTRPPPPPLVHQTKLLQQKHHITKQEQTTNFKSKTLNIYFYLFSIFLLLSTTESNQVLSELGCKPVFHLSCRRFYQPFLLQWSVTACILKSAMI